MSLLTVLAKPFRLLMLLFKFKIKHMMVIIFILTLFLGSIGEAVQQRNPGLFFYNIARAFIGADQKIVDNIHELVAIEDFVLLQQIGLLWSLLGNFYLLFYMFYYFWKFLVVVVNNDINAPNAFLVFFIMMFMANALFFMVEDNLQGNAVNPLQASYWTKSVPFKSVYVFIANYGELYGKVQPIIQDISDVQSEGGNDNGNTTIGTTDTRENRTTNATNTTTG